MADAWNAQQCAFAQGLVIRRLFLFSLFPLLGRRTARPRAPGSPARSGSRGPSGPPTAPGRAARSHTPPPGSRGARPYASPRMPDTRPP